MKMNCIIPPSICCAFLLLSAALSTSLHAAGKHEHGHDHSHGPKKEIKIPESLPDLWLAIQTQHTALGKAVEAKDDHAVHDAESLLQEYMKALLLKTSALDEAARKRVDGQAKNLVRVYDTIHHAAEHGSWTKAAAEFKKADGGFALIAAQMPKTQE